MLNDSKKHIGKRYVACTAFHYPEHAMLTRLFLLPGTSYAAGPTKPCSSDPYYASCDASCASCTDGCCADGRRELSRQRSPSQHAQPIGRPRAESASTPAAYAGTGSRHGRPPSTDSQWPHAPLYSDGCHPAGPAASRHAGSAENGTTDAAAGSESRAASSSYSGSAACCRPDAAGPAPGGPPG